MKKYITFAITLLIVMYCSLNKAYCQATSANGFNTPVTPGVDYLGWASGVNEPLNINNNDAYPINFYTKDTQRASILGSGNPGFFGIGSFTPAHKLDVDSGDIDVNQAASGYMINGNYVLRYKSAPCWA